MLTQAPAEPVLNVNVSCSAYIYLRVKAEAVVRRERASGERDAVLVKVLERWVGRAEIRVPETV